MNIKQERKTMNIKAWCWATGLIDFGDKAPDDLPDGSGVIVIATGPKSWLPLVLHRLTQRSPLYNDSMVVPGISASNGPDKNVDLLLHWVNKCAAKNGSKQRHGVVFLTGASK